MNGKRNRNTMATQRTLKDRLGNTTIRRHREAAENKISGNTIWSASIRGRLSIKNLDKR